MPPEPVRCLTVLRQTGTDQRQVWIRPVKQALLIIPVENQVRELDAKILLACVAAARGFACVIGSRLEIDFHIASFPPSIYLSKSMTARSIKMFRIMQKLGHTITAWDEEALVHQPPEPYYGRRLSPEAIACVSRLFAWGEDNASLFRGYLHFPPGLPIHITGNPRGDVLRPELRRYFAAETEKVRAAYGDFLLVNTNFATINAFFPVQNLFLPPERPGEEAQFGLAAAGMTREFAEGLRDHKQAIFEHLQHLIPELEKAFPEQTIVVRPHPNENPQVYHALAGQCQRVRVVNEGNVIPWLSAATALVHNGCTTGIEAYIMGVPAVTYQPVVNEYYDYDFYGLPNLLSHQSFDCAGLCDLLRNIMAGRLGPASGEERRALMGRFLEAQTGPLAAQRIVEVLERVAEERAETAGPGITSRLHGRYLACRRRLKKWYKSHQAGSKYRPEYQRHRYPGLSRRKSRPE